MKKLLLLFIMAVAAIPVAKSQDTISWTDTTSVKKKVWFADIYLGYTIRTAKIDPAIENPLGARSCFKLGADVNRILPNPRMALGATIEWTVSSITTGGVTTGTTPLTSDIHTIYIAPLLTFMQPWKSGGSLYTDFSLGYVRYMEKIDKIEGLSLLKPLLGTKDTVGTKVSFGYRIDHWDLKCSLFAAYISTLTLTQGGNFIDRLNLSPRISLASISFTVGYNF